MPKKIDPALGERAVGLVREYRLEYPSLTAASAAVARQVGVGHESVRRWVLQADIDDGARDGVTSAEHVEIKWLKAGSSRLRKDVAILRAAMVNSTPARTYRSHRQGVVAPRTITDARVQDAVRGAAWAVVERNGTVRRVLAPGGLYGRQKVTALIRRTTIPDASRGAVDRAMRSLGLSGIRRDKGIRTTIPAKDGIRGGDLLNRDFTAPRPDHTWVMDFTDGRGVSIRLAGLDGETHARAHRPLDRVRRRRIR